MPLVVREYFSFDDDGIGVGYDFIAAAGQRLRFGEPSVLTDRAKASTVG